MRTGVAVTNPLPEGEASGWISSDYHDDILWDMHHAFEIVVVLTGRHTRWYEDGTALELHPGDVSLHGAWEPHGHHSAPPGCTLLVLFFYAGFLGQNTPRGLPWLSPFVAPPGSRPRTKESARTQVLAIAAELKEEIEQQPSDLPTALHLGILRLLFTLVRQWSPLAAGASASRQRTSELARIAPALNLLYENRAAHRVAVKQAADSCCLSPSRFAAVFRRTMGAPFGQFVLRSRLAHAARLMIEEGSSADAVATELGFSDVSHFHHIFSKHYGCTPAQYRQRGRLLPR